MSGSNCLVETKAKVCVITINRPPMNTLNRETLHEIGAILDRAEADDDIRAIVLTGAGDRMFSAGADISEFGEWADRERAEQSLGRMHALFNRIEAFSKPVIACLNGSALGGGNELQMACHLAIASANAELGLPEVRLGIMPGYGGTQRLPRLIGRRRALELMLTGERISAQTALAYGLVNRVVPQKEVREEAFRWAYRLAAGAPLAMKAILGAVYRGGDASLEDGLRAERENLLSVIHTEDAAEGISAFFSKRPPNFQGR